METRNMDLAEIESRVARFDTLSPMSTPGDLGDVSQEALDVVFARKIMPVILEKTKNPFGTTAAIYGAAGTTMNVSVCPPDQGPCLHTHHQTYETFMVLDGAFEFSIGEAGQEKLVLSRWDVFSCPPGVPRGFRNCADRDSVLLTVITGAVHERDDVSVPASVTHRIREEFGEEIVDTFRKIVTLQE